tara:strand:- start:286 stop:1566 length:1281 start_codon:yes stop_codon:yes gene_type:complete
MTKSATVNSLKLKLDNSKQKLNQKLNQKLDKSDFFSNADADETTGFFYGNQAGQRLKEYEDRANAKKDKSLKKLSNASNTKKALSKGLGSVSDVLSGGFCNFIPRIFSWIEMLISILFKQIAKLEKNLLKFCQALYVPKTILFITILVIALLEFLSRWFDFLGFLSNEHVLQAVYSIAKLLNVILIFIAVLMGVSKVIAKTDNNADNIPFPLLLVGSLVGSMPILYELLSLVALSSIALAYYSQKCNGKVTNTWTIVDNIGGVLLSIGVIGIVISFFQFRFKRACTGKMGIAEGNGIASLQTPNVLMLTCLSYFILLMLASGFEQTVSQNVSYWMGLMGDKENPNDDCVTDNNLNAKDDGMKKVLNIMLSIAITILMTIIIVIGVIPPVWIFAALGRINMKMREKIGMLINKIFALIITEAKKPPK